MKRLIQISACAALAGVALAAGAVSASADDQAVADAAIADFNERMTEAGGESSGPPDTTPVDEEEYAAENPGSECFGDFSTGLDAGGSVPGQTARADADHFSFYPEGESATASDEVDAGVVTVDAEHADELRDFVESLASDDMMTCLEEAFGGLLEEQAAAATDPSLSIPPLTDSSIDVTGESDLGIGDTSAHLQIELGYTFDDVPYEFTIGFYAAISDRTLVAITVDTDTGELVSDFDPLAELETLLDAV